MLCDSVWKFAIENSRIPPHSVHGLSHWRRVEKNGLLLAEKTGANVQVVTLFAVFHDFKRLNDGVDPGHGLRGAEFAATLRGSLFEIEGKDFELLFYACAHHTDGTVSEDPTIGTCWDADRLDLPRVGVMPDVRFMSTEAGKEVVLGRFRRTTAQRSDSRF